MNKLAAFLKAAKELTLLNMKISLEAVGAPKEFYKALESMKEADPSQLQEVSQWVAIYVNSESTRYIAETLRKAKEDAENKYSFKSSFGEGGVIGS